MRTMKNPSAKYFKELTLAVFCLNTFACRLVRYLFIEAGILGFKFQSREDIRSLSLRTPSNSSIDPDPNAS